jgi:hypothetical protein
MDVSRNVAVANQLMALANELLVNAGQAPATPGEDWRMETGFPKIKVIDGASLMLYSPVNPLWKPSQSAWVFSQSGAHVNDPSDPVGARSPAGFPMARGSVLYGDSAFANDADVMKYIRDLAAQNPDTDDDPTYNPDGVEDASLTLYDWAYYAKVLRPAGVPDTVIFKSKPRFMDHSTGVTFINMDAEFAANDVSEYGANGGVLARFAP